MPLYWEWKTDGAGYGRLFGAAATALAEVVKAPRVLVAAECVDDPELEKALRSTDWKVVVPTRKRTLLGTTSHGSLDAWRIVPREEASDVVPPIWRAPAAEVRACALLTGEQPKDWTEVNAVLRDGRAHLVSIDRDSVWLAGAGSPTIENAVLTAARGAAALVGGDIRVVRSA